MIEVRQLYKSFGEKEVLRDINAVFEPGKINMVIGASGSGKSTLTKCIVGLHEPTKGSVIYDGADFSAMSLNERKAIRKQIGFLFQGAALFDFMTVEENVMFSLKMFTDMSEADMRERVNTCLADVSLENVNTMYPAELSGGMKKRVGIARAIAMHPKYLFCDEPNSGLDPQTSIVIDRLIGKLTRQYNMTTIVISHDMNSVIEIGDHVIFIYKGDKWWEGDRHTIQTTDNPQVVEFVYASRFMKQMRK